MSEDCIFPRVFISYTSKDRTFVDELANKLKVNNIPVWYDEWEIGVGDSIVEKIFAGLDASDTLIVVLSSESVKSKWVREELSVAVMRRLSLSNIRILPVLIEMCDIPSSLQHIRYADFCLNNQEALQELLDALSPQEALWGVLKGHAEEFNAITEEIENSKPGETVGDKLVRLHSLLETALNLRTTLEFRGDQSKTKELDFYQKIGFLGAQGIEARSVVWHALVYYRSCIAHARHDSSKDLAIFAEMLDGTGYFAQSAYLGLKRPLVFPEEYESVDSVPDAIKMAMQELRSVMQLLCFDEWKRRNPYVPRQ